MNAVVDVHQIVRDLLKKSSEGRVPWEKGSDVASNNLPIGSQFVAYFPDFAVSVAKVYPVDGNEFVLLSFLGLEGELLHMIREFKNEANFDTLNRLYISAQEQVLELPVLFEKIKNAVDRSEIVLGKTKVNTGEVLADVQAARFLKKFAGNWVLTYKKNNKINQENLIVSEYGAYTIVRDEKKTHAFDIKNIVFDPTTSHVSFDKVETGEEGLFPAGRIRQREILDFTVKWTVLEGYAEYDKHYLKYERKNFGHK